MSLSTKKNTLARRRPGLKGSVNVQPQPNNMGFKTNTGQFKSNAGQFQTNGRQFNSNAGQTQLKQTCKVWFGLFGFMAYQPL